MLEDTQNAARVLRIPFQSITVRVPHDVKTALDLARQRHADAIVVLPGAIMNFNRTQLLRLAGEYRIPAMYYDKEFPEAGGLVAYGPNYDDLAQRAAVYVDKILKGAKPASQSSNRRSSNSSSTSRRRRRSVSRSRSRCSCGRTRSSSKPVLDQRGRLLRSAGVC
jgi:ABC-type uncharacterized transport system substrate-binding protein